MTDGRIQPVIHESGEDYLETILLIQERNGVVRSVDVANEMGYSKPSVSRAMGILRTAGYIVMEENGLIVLTELGRDKATGIYQRHLAIAGFLENSLGVSKETALRDACRIEHDLSQETYDKICEANKR
jgi:Mn-dependent DtxR family transcriptional regulator